MSSRTWTTVILAAGLGKRMRSKKPKAVHLLAGKPMVRHVLDGAIAAAAKRGVEMRYVAVVGHGADQVKAALGGDVEYAEQKEQLGTAHALAQAQSLAEASQHLLALNADVALVSPDTIAHLMERHSSSGAALTFLTAKLEESRGLGRVRRDDEGRVIDIVEEAEADEATRAQTEVNAGVYCFRGDWLWPRLSRVPRSPSGEYYLTDLIRTAVTEGETVLAWPADDPTEGMGINDRTQLARADAVMRERIRVRHMLRGVTLIDPPTIYIDADVSIGIDTTVYPNTMLLGRTHVGEDCIIGPHAHVVDSTLGTGCRVLSSTVERATLEDGVNVGPFSHLREGAHVGQGSHIGNFAEVKNSRLGRNTRMGHFSYIGDAEVGDDVNIGAGTITCNYDGVRKNRTVIGDGAFIGSDTMLVAPVEVGAGARTGAGSVINHDVPAGALAVGVPARVRRTKGG